MKKIFLLTALAVLLGMATATAQQIAVVSEEGTTTLFQNLPDAINGADPGSVIYLPGGGFSLPDSVKINKRLSIFGIGHKSNNDNVDGNTKILGNLWFNDGSSSSAVVGCYISGDVNIGHDGSSVNYVMVKCCNLNRVQVNNNTCMEVFINQNYVRGISSFGGSNPRIYNNVMNPIISINNGYIAYNILNGYWTSYGGNAYSWATEETINASNSMITRNIILTTDYSANRTYYRKLAGSDNVVIANLSKQDFGEDCVNVGDINWNDFFVYYNNGAISPASSFHLKENYIQYENVYGIYGGDRFNDKQIAPVPYITAKKIDQQTDAAGKLNVKIRVKAGE